MRTDVRIDWTIPPLARGVTGALQRFFGPGAKRGEYLVQAVGGVLCLALLVWWTARGFRDWSAGQIVVALLIAFDVVGGVLTNATNAAKRWYHRQAPGMTRERLLFVGVHVLHLAAVAFVLRTGAWPWFLLNAVVLAGSALLVEFVPLEVKRPVAMATLLAAVALNEILAPLPGALGWFVPFFYLKLLVCHLVPEAPMSRRAPDA
ncbi:hypothetical protein [Amycolatopsis anabasis]|uniref:hypothetical protein n=1 Tax=Amycolatopsis anabasis TaxID=1840409 RepID=UPI00131CD45D|nr:hypothetical protein [Amycolatopsis anabasis]